ncbi:MAG TPA: bifunctional DNA-formamidopyrimidine glycosylase/DNA-(apurinic or apyrimidinic site) lyase [Pyrinomonadaceae bacterium]|nr:bifunctional DNA-formamidopyrimidine glycosylase/DNA-(apurinic or apyrimidinic site) lyase [Pyrinomonadaceae bacterium]
MPELPEVEIVARSLDQVLKGRRIASAELIRQRLAPDTNPEHFSRQLDGGSINFVHRRGKHVLFDIDNGRTLITHLRMSGKFMLLDRQAVDPKFTHASFLFEDGERLVFQDQRHFGLMKIVGTNELHEANEIKKLAPEPLSEEFSYEYLRATLKTSKRSLKEFLLDQTKVCGLGNIYASEAMFLTGANPRSVACRLSKPKTAALLENIRLVLSDAVTLGSSMPVVPHDIGGSIYGRDSAWEWRVYDREDAPCINCDSPIIRIVQGGRSTYFCRKCQRR